MYQHKTNATAAMEQVRFLTIVHSVIKVGDHAAFAMVKDTLGVQCAWEQENSPVTTVTEEVTGLTEMETIVNVNAVVAKALPHAINVMVTEKLYALVAMVQADQNAPSVTATETSIGLALNVPGKELNNF